jgi:hypothetical protein
MASQHNNYGAYGSNQPHQSSPYSYPPTQQSTTYDSYRAYGQNAYPDDSIDRHQSQASYQQSPFKTPFDDENAYSSHNPSTYTLNGGNSNDPFADHTAIPLQSQKRSHQDGFPPPSPGLKDAEQPFAPYPPEQPGPMKSGKRKWLSGPNRIPIACYVLSLVQICVFIFELVKSCKYYIHRFLHR